MRSTGKSSEENLIIAGKHLWRMEPDKFARIISLDAKARQDLRAQSVAEEDIEDHLARAADEQVESSHVPGIVAVSMSDFSPRPVRWLWEERIPLGKLTLIAGDPGQGKSLVTMDLAARTSHGLAWPDGAPVAEPGSVLVLSAEDDPEDTIRPRLDAAGADPSRVFYCRGTVEKKKDQELAERMVCLERDIDALGELLGRTPHPLLIIIDPISAYVGSVDDHRNSEVRALLAQLATLAREFDVAVVLVHHLNKTKSGSAIQRVMGSTAYIAAVRVAWLVAPAPDDKNRRLLTKIKSNLARDPGGLAFSIEAAKGTPKLAWEDGVVDLDANDILAAPHEDRTPSKKEQAERWLRELLSEGPILAVKATELARDEGIAERTLDRAKADLMVASKKDGSGRWWWHLPGAPEVPGGVGDVGGLPSEEPSNVPDGTPLAGQEGKGRQDRQRRQEGCWGEQGFLPPTRRADGATYIGNGKYTDPPGDPTEEPS